MPWSDYSIIRSTRGVGIATIHHAGFHSNPGPVASYMYIDVSICSMKGVQGSNSGCIRHFLPFAYLA